MSFSTKMTLPLYHFMHESFHFMHASDLTNFYSELFVALTFSVRF